MSPRRTICCWPAVVVLGAGVLVYLGTAQDEPQAHGVGVIVQAAASPESSGCISCHSATDAPTMHLAEGVHLSCTDCHGGNGKVKGPSGRRHGQREYDQAMEAAHPKAKVSSLWKGSANPMRAAADWLREGPDYIRFVNPGDLRVAAQTCGRAGCHMQEVRAVRTSMMTHGAP